jgi:hypothetical protein
VLVLERYISSYIEKTLTNQTDFISLVSNTPEKIKNFEEQLRSILKIFDAWDPLAKGQMISMINNFISALENVKVGVNKFRSTGAKEQMWLLNSLPGAMLKKGTPQEAGRLIRSFMRVLFIEGVYLAREPSRVTLLNALITACSLFVNRRYHSSTRLNETWPSSVSERHASDGKLLREQQHLSARPFRATDGQPLGPWTSSDGEQRGSARSGSIYRSASLSSIYEKSLRTPLSSSVYQQPLDAQLSLEQQYLGAGLFRATDDQPLGPWPSSDDEQQASGVRSGPIAKSASASSIYAKPLRTSVSRSVYEQPLDARLSLEQQYLGSKLFRAADDQSLGPWPSSDDEQRASGLRSGAVAKSASLSSIYEKPLRTSAPSSVYEQPLDPKLSVEQQSLGARLFRAGGQSLSGPSLDGEQRASGARSGAVAKSASLSSIYEKLLRTSAPSSVYEQPLDPQLFLEPRSLGARLFRATDDQPLGSGPSSDDEQRASGASVGSVAKSTSVRSTYEKPLRTSLSSPVRGQSLDARSPREQHSLGGRLLRAVDDQPLGSGLRSDYEQQPLGAKVFSVYKPISPSSVHENSFNASLPSPIHRGLPNSQGESVISLDVSGFNFDLNQSGDEDSIYYSDNRRRKTMAETPKAAAFDIKKRMTSFDSSFNTPHKTDLKKIMEDSRERERLSASEQVRREMGLRNRLKSLEVEREKRNKELEDMQAELLKQRQKFLEAQTSSTKQTEDLQRQYKEFADAQQEERKKLLEEQANSARMAEELQKQLKSAQDKITANENALAQIKTEKKTTDGELSKTRTELNRARSNLKSTVEQLEAEKKIAKETQESLASRTDQLEMEKKVARDSQQVLVQKDDTLAECIAYIHKLEERMTAVQATETEQFELIETLNKENVRLHTEVTELRANLENFEDVDHLPARELHFDYNPSRSGSVASLSTSSNNNRLDSASVDGGESPRSNGGGSPRAGNSNQ